MMRIKTLLILSLAAFAVFGCKKSDLQGEQNLGYSNGEIEYSMYANRPTKAEILDNSTFATFEIDSYKHEDDPANSGTLLPLANYYKETVEKDAGSGRWAAKRPRRWLIAPGVLDFYAYSDKVNVSAYTDATASNAPTFEYTVGAAADQQDLLVGNAIGRTESSNQGKLSLDFKHALTQIGLKAKSVSPSIKVELKSVKFIGVNSVGKFSYDGTATAGAWSEQKTPEDYTFTVETPDAVGSLTAVEQISADGNMMFIPSANPEDVEIQVLYDVFTVAGDPIAVDVNKTIKIKAEANTAEAAAATITPWNMGKKVTYTLILTAPANEIIFGETTLEDWAAETEVEHDGKDIFSMSTMFLSPVNKSGVKVIVGDNRPTPGGFTIESSETWVKFSETANDADPKATLTYTPTASRAGAVAGVEIYVYSEPNLTGVKRTAKVTLKREGYNKYDLAVEQQGIANPFTAVTAFDASAKAEVTKVEKLSVSADGNSVCKMKAKDSWFTLSLDGKGAGAEEITVTAETKEFYIHTTLNKTTSPKTSEIQFFMNGVNIYQFAVKQKTTGALYVGRFAGELKTETVDNETHYYYDKELFAATSDEASVAWATSNSATGATSFIDGKANSAKLTGSGYPAANKCNTKTTGSVAAGTWYMPAHKQLVASFIGKHLSSGAGAYAPSTESAASTIYYINLLDGILGRTGGKSNSGIKIRCVQEL